MQVDLPFYRTREIKKDAKFVQLVQELEDRMVKVSNMS